jgi:hypothetical protein
VDFVSRQEAPAAPTAIRTTNQDRAVDDALGSCGREPGVHQPDHLLDRESVRDDDRLGAAVTGGEQFERSAAVGLWAAAGSRHWRVIGRRLLG